MEGISLKARAISFAFSMGAAAFILAMLAGVGSGHDGEALTRAVVVALIFGVMAWAVGEHTIAGVAGSVDAATERVIAAAQGDLATPTPGQVGDTLPELSQALDGLFHQVRSNLESVHALAMFDPVTSLPNRTSFRRDAERLLRTLGEDGTAALFFIDLDNFKNVNDTLGHAHGDQLLGMVANRLRTVTRAETVRHGDGRHDAVIGRLAGDEFTILFPQVEDQITVARMARGLLAALTEPFDLAGHRLEIGASIGIAMRPGNGRSLTALMRASDVAMYSAKAKGRGQFQFYSDELAEKLADKTRLEADLRAAVERDEFAVVFQPQVSMATGEMLAAEGLLRWNHPVDGLRMPGSFIGAAEENGLIYAIGDWAIEKSAETLGRWAKQGVRHRMAINLSPRQISRADFFTKLRDALARHNAPVNMLVIEITETLAMECGDVVIREIANLRSKGACISIDDFGAGYSNLARLQQMPVDQIKLDRSLIVDVATKSETRAIVQAVIGLIHGLGCTAVAEGVEDDAQIDVLRIMGCDAVQGFAIATPMSEQDLMVWSRTQRAAA
jgi:diguanylate cyclase